MKTILCVWLMFISSSCSCDCPASGSDASSGDGRISDAASADAASRLAWSSPRRLLELGSPGDERFPALADDLTIYFTRTEQQGSFIVNAPYRAHRASRESSFGPATRAATFGTTSISDLELASNGLEWFFWTGLGQLAFSTRTAANETWSQPTNIGVDGFSPSISSDRLSLYFVGFDGDVRVLERATPSAPWGLPTAIELNTTLEIKSLDISADRLRLLITAAIDSHAAGVHIATRASLDAPFETAIAIPALIGGYQNARFASADTEIVASGEFAGHSELFLSTLTPQR